MATMIEIRKQTIPETIVNDAPHTFTEATWPVGSWAAQGDLNLVRLAEMPTRCLIWFRSRESAIHRKNRQLADGNTNGSRHVLVIGEAYDCDRKKVAKAIKKLCPLANVDAKYIGPVFRTVDGFAELTHPEHGDHLYEGEMIVAVVFQRSLDQERREQRVRD